MTSVNEMNAVTREQARMREEVLKARTVIVDGQPYIKRADVLQAIRNDRHGDQQA